MKQLSTRTISFISLIAITFLALGVFAIQKVYNTPLPIVENEKTETQEKNEENILETTIDTLNWKTFRNEEYGFEMQIPSDWGMNKDTYPFPPGIGGEWFTAEPIDRVDNGKLRFTVAVFNSTENPITWFGNNVENTNKKSYPIVENRKLGNSSFQYIKKVINDSEYSFVDHAYLISNENRVFMIKFREKEGPENWQYDYSSSLSIFEAFVSSLKFL